MTSIFINPMSFVALYVNKIASGDKINEDIQEPKKGAIPSSCENRLPKVLIKWKVINIKTAKTMGNPSPPFLIIAPRGAPIKNIKKQANSKHFGNFWLQNSKTNRFKNEIFSYQKHRNLSHKTC